jgi:hypothetical protein
LLLAYSPKLRAILDLSRQQIADGKTITHEDFWADEKTAKSAKRQRKSTTKSA